MFFAEYCDSVAASGSWAGKFEAQILAEAFNMRLLIHASWDEILVLNPEGQDVACFYGGHWEFVQDADANHWLQRKRAAPPEEVGPVLVGQKKSCVELKAWRGLCVSVIWLRLRNQNVVPVCVCPTLRPCPPSKGKERVVRVPVLQRILPKSAKVLCKLIIGCPILPVRPVMCRCLEPPAVLVVPTS